MFDNTNNNVNNTNFNDILKLGIIAGLGFGVYEFGIYKGWWAPEKWKKVANEWEFFNKLPYEISQIEMLNLFTNRFNTMKGKHYNYKRFQTIEPIEQFDILVELLKNANKVEDFINIYDQLSYQINFAQFNDYVFGKLNKYPYEFIMDNLSEKEIPLISQKTFLKLDSGVAFLIDSNGQLIFEKNLYIYKGK
jgi:hypothetical protein